MTEHLQDASLDIGLPPEPEKCPRCPDEDLIKLGHAIGFVTCAGCDLIIREVKK